MRRYRIDAVVSSTARVPTISFRKSWSRLFIVRRTCPRTMFVVIAEAARRFDILRSYDPVVEMRLYRTLEGRSFLSSFWPLFIDPLGR